MRSGLLLFLLILTTSSICFAQGDGGAAAVSNQSVKIPRRLTLPEAENLLLQRNLAVASSHYQIEASRAARLIASYKPNPVLTIGAQQFPVASNISSSFPRFFSTNSDAGAQPTFTLHVDKIIERGGKREARMALADFQIKANEALLLDTIRTQMFQLRQAFTNAIVAKENLLLAEATEQQYQQTEQLTEFKVENGDQAGLELYRVRAGKLQYQQQSLQARIAYQQASRDLLNLLGAKPEEVLSTNSDLKDISQRDDDKLFPLSLKDAPLELIGNFSDSPVLSPIAELKQLALKERPDLIAARNNLAAAQQGLKLSQGQLSRDIQIGYEYQRVGSDSAVGVTVQVPLFIYNNQKAGIAQAEAQRLAAETQLRQIETQVTTDVEKAYQAYLSAKRTLELYNTQNLTQVQKLQSIASYSYKEGAASLFEVLDSQRIYNQTIQAYNQARADYQLSLWQLEQAIGRPLP